MTDENTEIDTTKKTFDLKARLQGRGLRSGSITLYTDEETGALLGDAVDVRNNFGIATDRRRVGVLGEIDALDPESATYKKDLEALEKKRDDLKAALDETSLVVSLRAVPPVIAKDAKRRAKAELKIKGKVDDSQIEDYNAAFTAYLLSDTITSIVDTESGGELGKQTYEECKALMDYLPASEFNRLDGKMAEIQFADAVSAEYIETADF